MLGLSSKMKWATILITAFAMGGCGTRTTSSFCDIYSPIYFDEQETVDWLFKNDRLLVEEIVIQNETWAELCVG